MSFKGNLKKALALQMEQRLNSAEFIQVQEAFSVLEFHQAGKHDQHSHGNWADGQGDLPAPTTSTSTKSGAKSGSSGYGPGDEVPKGPFPADQYDEKKGKPKPGTDAWLHAHNISRNVWNDRPYVRFEAGAPFESLPPEVQKLYENEPEGKRQLLNMMKQTGGLIMVRKPVPGAENVVPQSRPDNPVVTDAGKRAYRLTSLNNANKRLEQMQALKTKDDLVALQTTRLEKATAAVEAAKTVDREQFLAYANGKKEEAQKALDSAMEGLPRRKTQIDRKTATPEQLEAYDNAKKLVTKADKTLADATKQADHNFGDPSRDTPEEIAAKTEAYRKVEQNNAAKAVARASKKLDKINGLDAEGVKGQIAQEIDTAQGFADSAQNAYDKTAAKYLFPPNPSALKDAIDAGKILGKAGRVNVHGAENINNLVNGTGRVYLAMEGNIKEDSLLTAVKNEAETGAAVISVPSVTLWRHKEMLEVAQKYLGNGREVVLIPDADGVNNPRVRNEARAMQALLESVGAKVVVAPPPIPLDAKGKPLPKLNENGNPSNKVQQFGTDIPGSPKEGGVHEELKGVDDYLGLGRDHDERLAASRGVKVEDLPLSDRALGTLGNLAVQRRTTPPIDLSGTDVISAKGRDNMEKALRAISLIVGSKEIKNDNGEKIKVAAGQIGSTMLAAAMGSMNRVHQANSSLDLLERNGVIKIERVYDENALAQGIRRQHPDMTDARLNELVRAGVIARPSFEGEDTRPVEHGYEETPIISINPAWKDPITGKVHDFTSKDDTPVSLNSLGTHDTSASRIRSLAGSGKTYQEIADILGISTSTISAALKK